MIKFRNIPLLMLLITALSSCIALRSADYQLESNRNLLSNEYANDREDNIGVEFPQQILYIPMYVLYGGLSAIFMPFSKDFYKNDLATIIIDSDYANNLNPSGEPSFFMIPKCRNDLVFMAVGFMGKESELMYSENNQLMYDYSVKKEDMWLKFGDKIIKPNSIFLAGTTFDKISSRSILIHYPIARKKRVLHRFIEYPLSCKDLAKEDVSFVISKIYKKDKMIKSNIEIKIIKGSNDDLYRIPLLRTL